MKHIVIICLFLLGACSSHNYYSIQQTANIGNVVKESKVGGVHGTFELKIAGSLRHRGGVFLNTMMDYKSEKNVTIFLTEKFIHKFKKKTGIPPEIYFLGKRIIVKGKAKRVKYTVYEYGKETDKFYFQTQINLNALNQFEEL
ncbi:hypothetical protein L1286_18675 [Pseudoalteromonas sp. SMS1]|uniref:hypothetical protein n=1 Tax=Pseudoalteromonas sp. SMS1 TaxID=2908894 RepID=UPI001F45358C|nr:hypothetical protein [Pseudoalteromonas sp. SMS1]MCF2859514.1 hypothetical protein [Pseudoalteromonas sp. SMS1]